MVIYILHVLDHNFYQDINRKMCYKKYPSSFANLSPLFSRLANVMTSSVLFLQQNNFFIKKILQCTHQDRCCGIRVVCLHSSPPSFFVSRCGEALSSLDKKEPKYIIMSTTSFYVLFESAAGYGLFSILESDEISNLAEEVQNGLSDFSKFQRTVKMVSFLPFLTAESALENINAISEHELTDELKVIPPLPSISSPKVVILAK
jgi:hypothetical protein